MNKDKLVILDPTLRDGSHAIAHQFTPGQVYDYVQRIDLAGVNIAEVGHGLGLGASSAQIGISRYADAELNEAAINAAVNIKICNFVLPGFATIHRDIAPAIQSGISFFRVGTHCTEADLAKKHIEFIVNQGGVAMASLLMSHMVDADTLLEEARKFQSYGASAVTLMDSAGAFTLSETREKITRLADNLNIKVGYHGHNNLSLAVANSIVAHQAGATILDATAKGFGAGAGNTPIDTMVASLHREGYVTDVDLMLLMDATHHAEKTFIDKLPVINEAGVVSGYYGTCGAFQKHVLAASAQFDVPVVEIFEELSNRKAVAGQEDMIIEIASSIKAKQHAQ